MKLIVTEDQNQHIIAKQIEEEYPTTWDPEFFKTLRSYAKRVKYCQENLVRISSGSSRIVYKIDDEKVLKLAKNPKGILQNEQETQWKDDGFYGEILAQVLDSDPNELWVEMELARKVTPNIFMNIMGFPFKEYCQFLEAEVKYTGEQKERRMVELKYREQIQEDEFTMKLIHFIHDTNANDRNPKFGDYQRLSSYGLVNRDGGNKIVLIDFGLTSDIYNSYYS